jgi:hypothetical protein
MKRLLGLAFLGMALGLPHQVPADGVTPGNWRLTTMAPSGNAEITDWMLKIEAKDGQSTATLLAANPAFKQAELVGYACKGETVRLVVKTQSGELTFEGRISKDGKKIVGMFGSEDEPNAAYMALTTMTRLEEKDVSRKLGIAQLEELERLKTLAKSLERKGKETDDTDAQFKLLQQAVEAYKQAELAAPDLYLDLVAKQPNTFAAERAAMVLLKDAAFDGNTAELKRLADVASKQSAEFGLAWHVHVNMEIAAALLKRNKADLAVDSARRADQAVDAEAPFPLQLKVLRQLSKTLTEAGKGAEQKTVAERIEKVLDREYLATMPPFKGQPFTGRKAASDRVIVMELFTGAQCPPCVATDLAFDVLHNTYKASEVVLIQYHLHIPGPDPMTNADTESRAKYYKVSSTPSTLFNGANKGSGGGAVAAAEKKYDAFREIINPLLEEPTKLKITASAKRAADKIQIQTEVAGVPDPSGDLKLRLVLVEETVSFAGSNKIRIHHQVVRAMPGGVDGVALKNGTQSTKNEVDLKELRGQLGEYLDNYAATKRAFPQPGRPMEMHDLRVIAFVQDDSSKEILQAVQVNVD